MTRLKSNANKVVCLAFGVAAHHFGGQILDYSNSVAEAQRMERLQNKLDNIEEMNRTMAEKINNISDNSVPMEKLNSLNHNLDVWCDKFNTLKKYLDLSESSQDINQKIEYYHEAYKRAEECEKHQQVVKDIMKNLVDSSDSSNTLLPNFNLDFLYDYLNSLTLMQESAFFHIIVLLGLGIIIFNILGAVLGNSIIEYFKLEEKYPKLAGILRLRLKFQKYYLIYSFSLMYLIILVAILLNLLVLFKL